MLYPRLHLLYSRLYFDEDSTLGGILFYLRWYFEFCYPRLVLSLTLKISVNFHGLFSFLRHAGADYIPSTNLRLGGSDRSSCIFILQ